MGPRVVPTALFASALTLLTGCQGLGLAVPAPLAMRNQHPVELTALQPKPRPARTYAQGPRLLAVELDWTNLWLLDGGGMDRIFLDGELLRAEFRLGWGLSKDLDLELGLPVMYTSGGILDGLIESWHDLFNLTQSGRTLFPRDRFDILVERNTGIDYTTSYRLEGGDLGLGDIPVQLAYTPFRGEWSLGVRGSLELPTGNEAKGFGNGGVDSALSAFGAWQRGRLALFAWGGYCWIATPDQARRSGLGYTDRPYLGAGFEFGLFERTSLLLQCEIQRSVLADLRESHVDREQAGVMGGLRYRFGDGCALDLGIGEDVHPDLTPDVTFHMGLRFDL